METAKTDNSFQNVLSGISWNGPLLFRPWKEKLICLGRVATNKSNPLSTIEWVCIFSIKQVTLVASVKMLKSCS